eukprot:TRINITY_DN5270_c0_g1_i1.p2 TRINITY_DN5270_c0_g1~~TRINITY_DN5270_c0_g1_i1.p2  ORF type:complete len:52 (+),score=12.00 TRINITY_DN5270_c0_g1_i1:43-198(+)
MEVVGNYLNEGSQSIRDSAKNIIINLNRHSPKKEKSTDCDSALIPLLCVHG